jgi:hypothetical protein
MSHLKRKTSMNSRQLINKYNFSPRLESLRNKMNHQIFLNSKIIKIKKCKQIKFFTAINLFYKIAL